MKYLFLMQGIPGSGKSTFLKKWGLKESGLVISSDDLRQFYAPNQVDIYDKEYITNDNDSQVWKNLFNILEFRMSKGYTTIVDATHYSLDSIKKYKSLCQNYDYQLFVVRFDQNLITAGDWNSNRPEYKRVPIEVILKMFEKMEEEKDTYPKWINVIDKATFLNMFKNGFQPFDYNQYNKIHIFGDIHGCMDPLKEYFDKNPFNEYDLYIFTGDYLDRGPQNKEVLEFLLSIKDNKNVKFLEGNHERWLKLFGKDKINEIRSPEFIENTLEQIQDIDKVEVRKFCKKLSPFLYFKFGENDFVVTHGGIPSTPNLLFSENDYIKGIGKYQDMQKVDESFCRCADKINIYSIHGHRNVDKVAAINTISTFNLEGQVEFGGNLRVLQLTHGGFTIGQVFEIKNNNFRDPNSNEEIIKKLRRNPLIKVKKLGDGLESFNFNRDAFEDKAWNSQTITARGLFINSKTNEIVARSYNKFFNFNELPETTEEELRKNLMFPVTGYLKENGYLGILSWNPITDDFLIATKSQISGPHTDNFKRILFDKYKIQKNLALQLLLKEGINGKKVSLIFEVIDPVFDPHIIKYDEEHIVLLDCVTNEFKPYFMEYTEEGLVAIANLISCKVKQRVMTFRDADSFFTYLKTFPTFYKIEGFVFEDLKGYKFKFKTPFYTFWKLIRNSFARPNQTVRDLFESRYPEEFKYIDSLTEEKRSKFVKNNQFRVIDFYTEFYEKDGFSTGITTKSTKI